MNFEKSWKTLKIIELYYHFVVEYTNALFIKCQIIARYDIWDTNSYIQKI